MIVEIPLRGEDGILLPQDCREHVLGAGLAVAARDSDDQCLEQLAMLPGQILQCHQSVSDLNDGAAQSASVLGQFADHHCSGTCGSHLRDKVMCIKPFPNDRKKHIPTLNLPGVCSHPRSQVSTIAGG